MTASETPLDTLVAIETPEHIVFQYRVAGPARRLLAYVLDLLVCYGAVTLFAVIVMLVTVGSVLTSKDIDSTSKGALGLVLLALFAAQWIYFVAFEAAFGRSPGKMAFGLRVVTAAGRPIGWRAAALRNLLRTADFLPTAYVVAGVSMALTSRFQRIGDIVAGTMVVIPERARHAAALVLTPPADRRELVDLPEHVLLDADERLAIELFLRRRHTLGHARSYELAAMVAGPIGARFGYSHPDPARLLALIYDRAVNSGRREVVRTSWLPRRADATAGPVR